LSAATAFFDRSIFCSGPLITCEEPTLFFGASWTAAFPVPPSDEERDERDYGGRRGPPTE
jgi:hypothetical protein